MAASAAEVRPLMPDEDQDVELGEHLTYSLAEYFKDYVLQ